MSQKSLQEFFSLRTDSPKRRRSPGEDKEQSKKLMLSNMGDTAGNISVPQPSMNDSSVGQISVSQLMTMMSDLIDRKGLAKKEDLTIINAEIENLKKENKDLHQKIDMLNKRLNGFDRTSRKNNLIFGGIEYTGGNWITIIEDFVKQVLCIEQGILIGRAFPLGKEGLRKRLILVEFLRGEEVNLIMSKVGVLRGTNFFVHRDYSMEERLKRSKLSSIKREIMKCNDRVNASFRRDALLVNEVPFVWDLQKGFMTAKGEDGIQALRGCANLDLSDFMANLILPRNGGSPPREQSE
ncbi:hypothetical protein GE061_008891 [Apolygus lucorum]|uniref:Uncharacterized protein n=1 Tax=Apolygus lucorum TaxID=248454 RepID=A0A8S9XYK9_APOLU|nr:hypothetical protein GE061_008891 [Apolygus lucorum]